MNQNISMHFYCAIIIYKHSVNEHKLYILCDNYIYNNNDIVCGDKTTTYL